MSIWQDKFAGALLGGAVGDAIGLPREGLSFRRGCRLFGDAPLNHRFFFGRGMISDDTEHACMTAQALLASHGSPDAFARSLAWRLRGWLLGIPAGIGWATLRSILKLWIGVGPSDSGVRSAGNGPAMRAPILGVWIATTGATPEAGGAMIEASTCLTHTDPRAIEGATVIARTTAFGVLEGVAEFTPERLIPYLQQYVHGQQLRENIARLQTCLEKNATTREFVESLGLKNGVSGYINHTVPVALYCCLRWPSNFRRAVEDAVLAGGDADTTAAIVGGMVGAIMGTAAIPRDWIDGIMEWPRSVAWMRSLAERLAQQAQGKGEAMGPLPLFWPGFVLRNPIFAGIVLAHGFRRLLPPY